MWYNWMMLDPGDKVCKKLNKYNNSLEFQKWFTRLYCMVLNLIKIEGLPDTCNERYFKMCLLNHGTACIAKHEGAFISVGCAIYGDPNIYGEWRYGMLYGFGKSLGKVTMYLPGSANYEEAQAVLCRANALNVPPVMWIYRMAERLAKCVRTIDTLSEQIKNTRIVLCEESQVASYANVLKKVYDNELIIYAGKSIDPDAVKSIPTAIDGQLLVTAWDSYRNTVDEFCTDWGIQNANHTDKKERLLVGEIESNNAYIENNRDIMMRCLKDFEEQVNEVFGLGLRITWNGGDNDEDAEKDELWSEGEGGSGSNPNA